MLLIEQIRGPRGRNWAGRGYSGKPTRDPDTDTLPRSCDIYKKGERDEREARGRSRITERFS